LQWAPIATTLKPKRSALRRPISTPHPPER
jgi:hypothetical protein